jgi:ComF family protein
MMSTPGIAGLSVLYRFEQGGCLQSLLHQMKYRGMTRVGVECGKRLGEVLEGMIGGTPPLGVIPVPLHRTKHRERGYNQSEYIARGIASVLRIPVLSHTLLRHRHTESQTTLSREERQQNVADAFSVRPGAVPLVRRQTHLLVDDVITTGATLQEAARALTIAGAQPSLVCAIGIAL